MKIDILSPQAIYELGKRSGQEDAIFPQYGKATELDSLFIVCDGMGGHERGEVASNTVAQAMADFIFQNTSPDEPFSDQLFEQALNAAYLQLDQIDDGAAKKPGTTLTFLYLHRNGCTVAHIGDSRIYHVRPQEGRVLYRSRDHSVVYDLYLAGEIEYDEMNSQPNKNIITKAMMPGTDHRQKANITHIADVKPGDYFYLCSDGMLEQMTDQRIVEILAADTSDEKKREQLIADTKDNKDNHSAYLIHVNKVTSELRDRNLPDNEAQMMAKAIRPDERDTEVVTVQLQADDATAATTPRQHTTRKPQAADIKPAKNNKPATQEKKAQRSLLVPAITTAALLLILAGVYFTCSGKEGKEQAKTEEVKKDPVADDTKTKPTRDTMNIIGGEVSQGQLPTPTDGLQQPEQKPQEEKKAEEKKADEGKPASSEPDDTPNIGAYDMQQSANQPATDKPATDTPATPPTTGNEPPQPPVNNAAPQPQPSTDGPKSVIPDDQ